TPRSRRGEDGGETLTLGGKTGVLKSLPMLASIPTEALADLATRAREIHRDPRDALYPEGEPDRAGFILVDGRLELRTGRAVVRIVKPGMSIGELWLGEGEPHLYTLIAIDHSHVLHIAREDVEEAMSEFPELGTAMTHLLARRVHELTTRV